MVPGLAAGVVLDGARGVDGFQTNAVQVSRSHHHPHKVPPQGTKSFSLLMYL